MTRTAAGVLPASPAEKTPVHASATPPAAPAAAPVAPAADVDKIKAEHMRSSSAMPALGPLQLGTKSSLLPSAAADAARLAGDAAAALPRSQTIATPGAQGQGPATALPSLDAKDKPGVLLWPCHYAVSSNWHVATAVNQGIYVIGLLGDCIHECTASPNRQACTMCAVLCQTSYRLQGQCIANSSKTVNHMLDQISGSFQVQQPTTQSCNPAS